MNKRFFKVSYTWFEDLSFEAAVLYGYLLNSLSTNKIFKVDKETGELYYRVPNSFIESGLNLSAFKIKSLLQELDESEYIEVLITKKANMKCRYIKFNVFGYEAVFDVFYDLLKIDNNENIKIGTLLSFLTKEINIKNETKYNEDRVLEVLGYDLSDAEICRLRHYLLINKLIDWEDEFTDNMFEIAKEHSFTWIKRKDC